MMTDIATYAHLGQLIQEMKAAGSWCGETHVQKGAYIAKVAASLPIDFDFVIYKHGPFSFDLRAMLAAMRADGVVTVVPQGFYGPSYEITDRMKQIIKRQEATVGRFSASIKKVAQFLGSKNVVELEKIATAVFIKKNNQGWDFDARAAELNRIKPHISLPEAIVSTKEADEFLKNIFPD